MIERIQLFKLDGVDATGAAHEHRARVLREELAAVPGVLAVRVGIPADAPSAKSWDVAVVLSFRDVAEADGFLGSEAYRQAVERAFGGASAFVKGWSFALVEG